MADRLGSEVETDAWNSVFSIGEHVLEWPRSVYLETRCNRICFNVGVINKKHQPLDAILFVPIQDGQPNISNYVKREVRKAGSTLRFANPFDATIADLFVIGLMRPHFTMAVHWLIPPDGSDTAQPSELRLLRQLVDQDQKWRNHVIRLPGPGLPSSALIALASCQYPADLSNGRSAYRSLARLADRLAGEKVGRRFLLLAGDTVYSDATAGLFDPVRRQDRYCAPYQQLFEQSAWQAVRAQTDSFAATLDDHELLENWEPTVYEPQPRQALPDGRDSGPLRCAYLGGKAAFVSELVPSSGRADIDKPIWRPLLFRGPVRCFVMDTRTERELRTLTNLETASLISTQQLEGLKQWLVDEHDKDRASGSFRTPKFILSGSMLLPRRLRSGNAADPATLMTSAALHADAWEGYPATQMSVLRFIAERQINNVVFLSGDEHLGCLARISLSLAGGGAPVSVFSIHAPPLHAPFPFANSRPDDFAAHEVFTLGTEQGSLLTVTVAASFADVGDGFVTLSLDAAQGQYRMGCDFDGSRGGLQEEIVFE